MATSQSKWCTSRWAPSATAQTRGMRRVPAICAETTGATQIWMCFLTVEPHERGAPHHHGPIAYRGLHDSPAGRESDDRPGPRAHRRRMDSADGAPRVHALRRAGVATGAPEITDVMGCQGTPEHSSGIHSNMPGTVPADHQQDARVGRPGSGDLEAVGVAPRRQRGCGRPAGSCYTKGLGYADRDVAAPAADPVRAGGHPPVALAAWMIDHDAEELRGHPRARSSRNSRWATSARDEVLDNITLTWLTNTGHLLGPPLLGEHARVLPDRQGRHRPGGAERNPEVSSTRRRVSWAEAGPPQAHLLPRARSRVTTGRPGRSRELFTTEVRAAFRSMR